jgi:hypothetical protein
MNKQNINIQLQKSQYWIDEQGMKIPFKYITPIEKLKEINAGKLMKEADKLHQGLVKFKGYVADICDEVYKEVLKDIKDESKLPKGNFTWFNYDRSIKVEVAISDSIDFDDLEIMACKAKLDEYLDENVQSTDGFSKELVMSAFETTKGRLDAKKVMALLKYKSKIKHAKFGEAMVHLEASIRRPDSTKYYRIYGRNEAGKFEAFNLNFSSI